MYSRCCDRNLKLVLSPPESENKNQGLDDLDFVTRLYCVDNKSL